MYLTSKSQQGEAWPAPLLYRRRTKPTLVDLPPIFMKGIHYVLNNLNVWDIHFSYTAESS
jgi:hypothetical protein